MHNFSLLNYEDLTEKELNHLSFISKEKLLNAFKDEKPAIFDFIELNSIDRKFFYFFDEENILPFLSLRDWSMFLFTNKDFKNHLDHHFPCSAQIEKSKRIFDNICLLFDFLQYKKANPQDHEKRIREHDVNIFEVYLKQFKTHLSYFSNKKSHCPEYYQKAKKYYLNFFKIYEKNQDITDYFLNINLIKHGIGVNQKYVNDDEIFSQTTKIISDNLHKDYDYSSKKFIITLLIDNIHRNHNSEQLHPNISAFKQNILEIENFDLKKFFNIDLKPSQLRKFFYFCADDVEFMKKFLSKINNTEEIIHTAVSEMIANIDEFSLTNNTLYAWYIEDKEKNQLKIDSFIKELHQKTQKWNSSIPPTTIEEQIKKIKASFLEHIINKQAPEKQNKKEVNNFKLKI